MLLQGTSFWERTLRLHTCVGYMCVALFKWFNIVKLMESPIERTTENWVKVVFLLQIQVTLKVFAIRDHDCKTFYGL